MYERYNQAPASGKKFRLRLALHALAALALCLASIAAGAIGFVVLEGMDWSRGLLNATMLISGLGPAEVPETTEAKIFASIFSLYAGFVFVAMSGILIAPVAHRLLHYFHWDDGDEED